MHISAIAYEFNPLKDFESFERKIFRLCRDAKQESSELVLFPEYMAMEIASLFAKDKKDIHLHLEKIQDYHSAFLACFKNTAEKLGIHICAGSFPVKLTPKRVVNRSYLFSPDGQLEFQDKIHLTRFEREIWGLDSGEELKVFHSALGKIAINICYDSEFSYLARAQAQKGAKLLLVPSCTETAAGYQRVK